MRSSQERLGRSGHYLNMIERLEARPCGIFIIWQIIDIGLEVQNSVLDLWNVSELRRRSRLPAMVAPDTDGLRPRIGDEGAEASAIDLEPLRGLECPAIATIGALGDPRRLTRVRYAPGIGAPFAEAACTLDDATAIHHRPEIVRTRAGADFDIVAHASAEWVSGEDCLVA